jgi:hypothetical protein
MANLIGRHVLLEHSSEGDTFVAVGKLLSFTGGRYNILGPVIPREDYARILVTGVAFPTCLLPFPVRNYTRCRHLMFTVSDAYRQKVPVVWRVDKVVLSHLDGCTIN